MITEKLKFGHFQRLFILTSKEGFEPSTASPKR